MRDLLQICRNGAQVMRTKTDLEWVLGYFDRVLTGERTVNEKIAKLTELIKELKEEIGME